MDPLIELTGVSFGYGAQNILEEIDLHLHPGQFVGLVGPSGAGKTTLLKLVLRLLNPTAGQIQRVRPGLRLTYVPQIETVDWNFPVTAEEVVLMGLDTVRTSGPGPAAASDAAPATFWSSWRSAIWPIATFAISPADNSSVSFWRGH